MKIRGEVLAALFLLLLFAAIFYLSRDWPMQARAFPLLIAIAGTGVSVCLMGTEILLIRSSKRKESRRSKTVEEGREAIPNGAATMILWTLILFALVLVLGFWMGSLLFMLGFTRFFGRETWKNSASCTAVILVSLYLVLSVILKLPIYGGFFGLSFY